MRKNNRRKKKSSRRERKASRIATVAPESPQSSFEKVMRMSHEVLTKTIWPAKLTLDESIDVLGTLIKAIVLSNTFPEDPEARAGLIHMIEDRLSDTLSEIYPEGLHDHDHDHGAHLWLVPPQGRITEPVGILWDGLHEEDSVDVVLGTELAALRSELSEMPADDDGRPLVIDGVEGLAAIDPSWDGSDTVWCGNPECSNVHDAHLLVAENLFLQAQEHRRQQPAENN